MTLAQAVPRGCSRVGCGHVMSQWQRAPMKEERDDGGQTATAAAHRGRC